MRRRRIITYTAAIAAAACAVMLSGCGDATPFGETSSIAVSQSEAEDINSIATGAYQNDVKPMSNGKRIRLTAGGEEVVLLLYQNSAADALLERLPLELSFFEASEEELQTDQLEEPLSLGKEQPGYDPIAGEAVLYAKWENLVIFTEDMPYSEDVVPIGVVISGLDVISNQTEDFTAILEQVTEE